MESDQIKLLTYNCWGLKYISTFRTQRLLAIANVLANPVSDDEDYDIVALQEVWCYEDWLVFDQACAGNFPYRRFFKSGIIAGPGLAILSKIPIERSFLYRFPINGRLSAFFRGDWYVGKSIAITILKPSSKNSIPIAMLNSHMHAPYALTGDASYSCHRACQAWDFARVVNGLKASGYAVVQVGDLNSTPGSLPHNLFTIEAGLADSWDQCQTLYSLEEIAKMTPHDQIKLGGITCDSTLNSWRKNMPLSKACRLDYALIDSNLIKPFNPQVKFTELLPPPYNCSYSDHFAYSVKLLVSKQVTPQKIHHKEDRIKVYHDLLNEINNYKRKTIPFQKTWRKAHFIASCILVSLIQVFAFIFGLLNPIIAGLVLLISTTLAVTGVVNGLIWFLGVTSEERALEEVEMEIGDLLASMTSKTDV
jgi:sphingomyelin phosphodiesterase 2